MDILYKIILEELSEDVCFVLNSNNEVIYSNKNGINLNDLIPQKNENDYYFNVKDNRWYQLKVKNFTLSVDKSYGIDKSVSLVFKKFTHATHFRNKELKLGLDEKTGLLRSNNFKELIEQEPQQKFI